MGITRSRVEEYDNRYTKEKVLVARDYIRTYKYRHQDIPKLLEAYNLVRNQKLTALDCKSCGIQKYYTSLENYVTVGTKILLSRGIDIDEVTPEVIITSEEVIPEPEVVVKAKKAKKS
jgi:hypothetical protein